MDVEVVLTEQTEKLNYGVVDYIREYGDEGKLRHLQDQVAVEIEYTQISTYKTADPSFANLTYILQEPFASIPSRQYVSFLQSLSPNYANVSSASPVILPSSYQDVTSPEDDETESEGGLEWYWILIIIICILVLPLAALIYHKRRTRREREDDHSIVAKERADNIKKHLDKKKSGDRSDLAGAPLVPGSPRDPRPGSSNTQATDSMTRSHIDSLTRSHLSTGSQVTFSVAIPAGRVGCIIDSSSETGPYICEMHEFSPLKNEIQVGDRILAVDDEDVQGMSAISVSKLLGSRSENEQRKLTVLREVDYDDDDDDEESKRTATSLEESRKSTSSQDPPGTYRHESSQFESSGSSAEEYEMRLAPPRP